MLGTYVQFAGVLRVLWNSWENVSDSNAIISYYFQNMKNIPYIGDMAQMNKELVS